MGATRPKYNGKSISGLIYDEAYKKTYTDWRTLYDQQAQQLDSMHRMGQSSHQVDAMRYAMEAQQARVKQQLDNQAMAPGQWLTSGTSTNYTFTGGTSMSPEEASRQGNRFWDRKYRVETDETLWRLNKNMVHKYLTHMGMSDDPDYHKVRTSPREFDKLFGLGAYDAYTRKGRTLAPSEMYSKPTTKPKSRLVPWTVRKFIVEGGKTVAQQLEKNRSDSMAKASKKFYVGHNETLLEALQRDFDIWTTGTSIRAAKPGEFTMQCGAGIIFT